MHYMLVCLTYAESRLVALLHGHGADIVNNRLISKDLFSLIMRRNKDCRKKLKQWEKGSIEKKKEFNEQRVLSTPNR